MTIVLSRMHWTVFGVLFAIQTVSLWLLARSMPPFSPPADARFYPLGFGVVGAVVSPMGWWTVLLQQVGAPFLSALIIVKLINVVKPPSN